MAHKEDSPYGKCDNPSCPLCYGRQIIEGIPNPYEHKDKGIIELELKHILDQMLEELKAIHQLLEKQSKPSLGRLGGTQ